MELWVDQVKLNSFADDTISSYSSRDVNDVIDKLQADSTNLLRFMASNALVANPKKTGFLLIRSGTMSESKSIAVGNETIKEESTHKILGMVVDNRLKWDEHVYGQNGVLPAVNKRVGVLRRLSNHIPRKYLPQIATAIVSSKIRYGLGIYGTVRTNNRDPHDNHQKDLQIVLNKAMRLVTGKKLSDRVSINDLCTESGMLSVNRMSAIDKISLTWNSLNDPKSPLADALKVISGSGERSSRAKTRGDLQTLARTALGQRNVPHSAVSLWNQCESTIRSSVEAKKIPKNLIRKYAESLPI